MPGKLLGAGKPCSIGEAHGTSLPAQAEHTTKTPADMLAGQEETKAVLRQTHGKTE